MDTVAYKDQKILGTFKTVPVLPRYMHYTQKELLLIHLHSYTHRVIFRRVKTI